MQQSCPKNEIRIVSVQKRKKTVQLTSMHREIELTFHLMFIKGWNAVLLSKKIPILVGFFLFGFWD